MQPGKSTKLECKSVVLRIVGVFLVLYSLQASAQLIKPDSIYSTYQPKEVYQEAGVRLVHRYSIMGDDTLAHVKTYLKPTGSLQSIDNSIGIQHKFFYNKQNKAMSIATTGKRLGEIGITQMNTTIIYNNLGLVTSVSDPYFAYNLRTTDSQQYITLLQTGISGSRFTKITDYDKRKRIKKRYVISLDGNDTTQTYTYQPSGLTIKSVGMGNYSNCFDSAIYISRSSRRIRKSSYVRYSDCPRISAYTIDSTIKYNKRGQPKKISVTRNKQKATTYKYKYKKKGRKIQLTVDAPDKEKQTYTKLYNKNGLLEVDGILPYLEGKNLKYVYIYNR